MGDRLTERAKRGPLPSDYQYGDAGKPLEPAPAEPPAQAALLTATVPYRYFRCDTASVVVPIEKVEMAEDRLKHAQKAWTN